MKMVVQQELSLGIRPVVKFPWEITGEVGLTYIENNIKKSSHYDCFFFTIIIFQLKIQQDSPDNVRRGMRLLAVLILDILFYYFPTHISKCTHIIAVAPQMSTPKFLVSDL